jgi:hypothetical protein
VTVTFAAVITDASQTLVLKQIEFGDTRKSGTINLGWRAATSVRAPIVDQNGNPIPGARLVPVPEPKSILLVNVLLVWLRSAFCIEALEDCNTSASRRHKLGIRVLCSVVIVQAGVQRIALLVDTVTETLTGVRAVI